MGELAEKRKRQIAELKIQKKLKEFEEEIFRCRSFEHAHDIRRRLEQFEKENNVTDEQLQSFVQSGAGEELYMLTSAPTSK